MIDLTGVPEIPKIDLPHFRAYKKMEDNKPAYPQELLESLDAYTGDLWAKQSKPNFRGWFGGIGNRFDVYNPEAIPNGVDLDDIGYIGIWRGRTAAKEKPIIWCVVPSMTHGCVESGGIVEVGDALVRIGWKQEDLDAMVEQGYEIMMAMIAEHGEYREAE